MLRALHIRDFVIVPEAEISFEDGFTVFSGETGAGKSILIDALALTLGERADSTVVRREQKSRPFSIARHRSPTGSRQTIWRRTTS